ncbi:MAG: 4-hydroxy-3-methylbut-2-enyl diphosphate reductase [Pseudomonadales bacterium]|nr:4-hydroxy-3-methylbut-2-enyl diphosphate reductase [Pseudomonadales bacterium]
MEIFLANPRGFCAGVDRAIEIVNQAIKKFGAPIYVRHEVVHNRTVVAELKTKGAIFVDEVEDVPSGAIIIFSAHGVSKAVRKEAEEKDLTIFDATCPLVTKVHNEVKRFSKEKRETILIGHAGHPEVEGTLGQFEDPSRIHLVGDLSDVKALKIKESNAVSYVTQTTLSVEDTAEVINALRVKLPEITGPKKDDICYATQNRQDAIRALTESCELILVVGSVNSSNSNRLRELSERLGVPSYLIDSQDEIEDAWFDGVEKVGLSSGASAPETLVKGVIERLNRISPAEVTNVMTHVENIAFSLPKELR